MQIIFKGEGATLSTFSQSISLIIASQEGIQASFFTSRSVICIVPSHGPCASVRYVSPSYFKLDEDYIFYILSEGL